MKIIVMLESLQAVRAAWASVEVPALAAVKQVWASAELPGRASSVLSDLPPHLPWALRYGHVKFPPRGKTVRGRSTSGRRTVELALRLAEQLGPVPSWILAQVAPLGVHADYTNITGTGRSRGKQDICKQLRKGTGKETDYWPVTPEVANSMLERYANRLGSTGF